MRIVEVEVLSKCVEHIKFRHDHTAEINVDVEYDVIGNLIAKAGDGLAPDC